MRRSEALYQPSYRDIVDELSQPVAVFDNYFNLIYANLQFNEHVSRKPTSLFELLPNTANIDTQQIQQTLLIDGRWQSHVESQTQSGQSLYLTLTSLNSDGRQRYVATFEFSMLVTAPNLSFIHQKDPLTSLPNRYSFLERLRQRIVSAEQDPNFAILYFDIDHFKDINELYGHEVGDQLLNACAEKIRDMLRKSDVLARLSGDEFAAMVEYGEDHEMPYLCHRLMRSFERPVSVGRQTFQVSISIGIAFYPDQGTTEQQLLINAERAMFAAKKSGRAQFQLFDRKLSLKNEAQQRMVESLRFSLQYEPEQFTAAYQPLYNLQTGEFKGVEVLSRWCSPELGQVPPDKFIALAEARGLINLHSARMFALIERDVLSWCHGNEHFSPVIAVNVSVQQIDDQAFQSLILTLNEKVKAANWQLELEVIESQLMTLTDRVIEQFTQWREVGIRIAIDDFGTGYSCLAYLHQLPIDKLKIDRQFLKTQTQSRKEDQIIYAILSMANALNIEVLAEGIESDEQRERLQQLGCQTGQGFGLAKPQPWHKRLMTALPAL
ncbi:EAL domain-containing protein [Reinekea forsetii]|nr:EAL domain-containing protein [Reinekea forsetii]